MTTDKKVPRCIGIILDGNRRWAKKRNLPSLEGHRQGMERLKEVTRFVRDRGIEHFVVYAFSAENWNRSEEEISYLMKLFRAATEELFVKLAEENIRIRFVGERARFDREMRQAMSGLEAMNAGNAKLTLWVCISYGGRAEILRAANSASKEGEVTEEALNKNLWTAGLPDPDLIIRTGGEKRLSGFLTWQSVYSELFFVDEYWPDFSEAILDTVLNEYGERNRRMGT